MAHSNENDYKLWGARFMACPDELMKYFNNSISIDKRMWREDIFGSKCWAKSIQLVGIINSEELELIINGLEKIFGEWEKNEFLIKSNDEDIHTANERRLKELIGDCAMKLHTGRSRNDQVTTDMRLWFKNNSKLLMFNISKLINSFLNRAISEIDALIPGYTHLQRAQPIRWSHLLLSYVCALDRDYQRINEWKNRVEVSPLGSGAIAGNPFQIDREVLAQNLGFPHASFNSIDSIQSRDFVYEFLFICTSISLNLSKFAEDLIIYSSKEFNFIKLSDCYSTGSSLMPQKKNPDSLELLRGSTGFIFGRFNGFLMTIKSLPTSYNKDLQEDKIALFEVFDKTNTLIEISEGVIRTLTINRENMLNALSFDLLATDIAYYLVRKGIPFRLAHSIAGQCVSLSEKLKCSLNELRIDQLKNICDQFDEDFKEIFDFEKSVEQYQSTGSTSKRSVNNQIEHFLNLYKPI